RFQGGRDGQTPSGNLVMDAKGNLYGTTQGGGKCSSCGTVFKLIPPTVEGGAWTEHVVHYFAGGPTDGMTPVGGGTFYKGSLYGTTQFGGQLGSGTVYQIVLTGGVHTESVLYSFGNTPQDVQPTASVIFDKAGNLYGTTSSGGRATGTVFELQPPSQGGGNWT